MVSHQQVKTATRPQETNNGESHIRERNDTGDNGDKLWSLSAWDLSNN